MIPAQFVQQNSVFGSPDNNPNTIPIAAFKQTIPRGPWEGAELVVVAWKPDAEDVKRLLEGGVVYVACIGGLPHHFLKTKFEEIFQE